MKRKSGEARFLQGPWKQLFEGNVLGHASEIKLNPESVVLATVFDEENGKKKGALTQLFKVFHATGNIDGFVETFPKDAIVVSRHDPKKTMKFLLLPSEPAYSPLEKDSLEETVDEQLKQIETSAKLVGNFSKAYDIELSELEKSGDETKNAFFSQPLLAMELMPNSLGTAGPATADGERDEGNMQKHDLAGEIILGVSAENQPLKEPLRLFSHTVIYGGTEKERNHAMHILIESALLSSLPAIVFDWSDRFSGLKRQTEQKEKLLDYKLDVEPIGFPFREFKPKENIKACIPSLNADGVLELFETGNNVAAQTLAKAVKLSKAESIDGLIKEIEKMPATDDWNDFHKLKTIRLAKLLDVRYPGFFGGQNNVEEISKKWLHGIGRTSHISLAGLDKRQSLIMVDALLRELLNHFRKHGSRGGLKTMVFIPETEKLAPFEDETLDGKSIAETMLELKTFGTGIALSTPVETDLDRKLLEETEAKIGIVKNNDIGVQIRNKRQYRAMLRPGLSACSELQ